MRRSLFFTLAVSGFVFAESSSKFVSIAKISEISLKPGQSSEIKVLVSVQKGFHVQANPASTPNLIATLLKFESSKGIEWGNVVYPTGKPYKLTSSSTPLSTYDGRFVLSMPVIGASSVEPGKKVVTGTIRYQACNDKTCFPPSTTPIKTSIHLVKK